ncbi:MAG TPA: HlyD family secretion protein [Bacteroidales bacterium]|nr:HlyD family secretion protein [Bacteroidales bacterium]
MLNTMKNTVYLIAAIGVLVSCSQSDKLSDAYGNFETEEILISSETGGKILALPVEEGAEIAIDQLLCITDSSAVWLQKKQVEAQISAVASRKKSLEAQIEVLEQQHKNLVIEQKRAQKLLAQEALAGKQLDEINGNLSVIEKQKASVSAQFESIDSEIGVLQAQINLLDDKLLRTKVLSPIKGTVLKKFAEQNEIATPGKALLKIANISFMYLRAYVSGSQLAQIKLGQDVNVIIDGANDSTSNLKGTITFIAQNAEFTPKIIQTKEERVDLVYAIKVKVANSGAIKIGMPGEVVFQ